MSAARGSRARQDPVFRHAEDLTFCFCGRAIARLLAQGGRRATGRQGGGSPPASEAVTTSRNLAILRRPDLENEAAGAKPL